MIRSLPNVITLTRLLLVPVTAYFLATGAYGTALIVFMLAAISDFLDGFIARRFHVSSRLGAVIDPIADKLNMFAATVLLAWQEQLPLWLAIAIVARDVLIVGGVIAYRRLIGSVKMAPTMLSKINTTLEFALLLAVMAGAAGWLTSVGWLQVLFAVTFATVLASGAQYVWIWGRKARRERSRGP
jgi:cardiolipin synthase